MRIEVSGSDAQSIISALHVAVRDDLDKGYIHTAADNLRIAKMFLSSVDSIHRDVYARSALELSEYIDAAL